MTDPVTPEPNPYAAPAYGSTPGGAAPAKSPVLSIISLITGILGVVTGFFGWGLLFSIAAVAFDIVTGTTDPNEVAEIARLTPALMLSFGC